MAENGGNTSERLLYLLIGAGIGATVALLFAPKSGRELRGDIADATRKGIDYTSQGVRYVGDKATDVYQQTAQKASDLYGQTAHKAQEILDAGKETLSSKREQLAAAIEAGKGAYTEEKNRARAIGKGGETGGEAATPGNA